MRRIVVAGAALVVALAVGFGVGWLVLDHGEQSDADLACEQAETLPTTFFEETTSTTDTMRSSAIATFAQVAGARGGDIDDLDELGEAGAGLLEAMATFDEDRYAEARQDLLDACADR